MGLEAVSMGSKVIVGIVFGILYVIAFWKIFKKAGEAGWKSIIPFYNMYIFYKISWKTSAFWVWLIGIVVSNILGAALPNTTAVSILVVIIAVIAGIVHVIAQCKMGFVFGKGVLFAIGLFFLNPLFMIILGFGSAQYQGLDKA